MMLGADRLLANSKSAPVQSFGLCVPALTVENQGDTVECARDIGMFETELLLDREIAFEQELRLRISTLIAVKQPKIIEIAANRGVLRSQRLFSNGQCAFVQRFGFRKATLPRVQQSQVVDGNADGTMVWPDAFSRMASERLYRGSASA